MLDNFRFFGQIFTPEVATSCQKLPQVVKSSQKSVEAGIWELYCTLGLPWNIKRKYSAIFRCYFGKKGRISFAQFKKNNSFPWFPTLPFLCRVTIKSLWLNVLWIRRGGWNKRIRLRAITPQCITMLPYIVYYVSPFCVQPRFRARLSICYLSNSSLLWSLF